VRSGRAEQQVTAADFHAGFEVAFKGEPVVIIQVTANGIRSNNHTKSAYAD
jgi:hypothetical protein